MTTYVAAYRLTGPNCAGGPMQTRKRAFRWSVVGQLLVLCATAATLAACSPETTLPAQSAEILPLPLECSAAGYESRTYPLRVEAGHRYLVAADGRPYLLNGDAAWSLIAQLRDGDVDRYLDDRKSRHFNAVIVSLIEARYASKAPANIYGEQPFTRRGDFTTPNEAYFKRADSVIKKAADRGLLVLLVPAYFGYDEDGWYDALVKNGEARIEWYGRYLGARYGRCSNVLWVIGGDRTPPDTRLGDALARGIRATAPSSLFTAHADSEASVDAIWGSKPWLTVNTLFTYEDVWPRAVRLRQQSPKPFFLIESAYENDGWHVQTPTRIRAQAYHAILAGATGHVFGNNPLWHFDGPGCCSSNHFPTSWQEALDLEGSRSMAVLARVFDRYAWYALVPDTNSTFVVEGIGSGHDRVAAALTPDGNLGMVYVPSARTITLDLHRLREPVRAIWIDPTNGAEHSGPEGLSGKAMVTTLGRNAAGGQDWLLVVRP